MLYCGPPPHHQPGAGRGTRAAAPPATMQPRATRRRAGKRRASLGEHGLLGADAVGDRHGGDEVDEAGGVAPLVVVPGDELDKGRGEHDAAPASKTVEQVSPTKSEETTWSSV